MTRCSGSRSASGFEAKLAGMGHKRPCSVCRRWFEPKPRVRHCQRTCGRVSCRAEQRRRTQLGQRKKNPSYWCDRRLQARLQEASKPGSGAASARPPPAVIARVPWESVQDALGVQASVIIEFLLRLSSKAAQDAMRPQVYDITEESRRVIKEAAQDALGSPGPAP